MTREIIFTCIKCEANYEVGHMPQPVIECPVCGWTSRSVLAVAIAKANKTPLPRCPHGNALADGAGEHLEPSCGCRYTQIINLLGDLDTYADELDGDGWYNAANGCRAAIKEIEGLRSDLKRLWHFAGCPYEHCETCIADAAWIKTLHDRLGPPSAESVQAQHDGGTS